MTSGWQDQLTTRRPQDRRIISARQNQLRIPRSLQSRRKTPRRHELRTPPRQDLQRLARQQDQRRTPHLEELTEPIATLSRVEEFEDNSKEQELAKELAAAAELATEEHAA